MTVCVCVSDCVFHYPLHEKEYVYNYNELLLYDAIDFLLLCTVIICMVSFKKKLLKLGHISHNLFNDFLCCSS